VSDGWLDNTPQLTFDSPHGRLVEIGLYPGVGEVLINGLSLFGSPASEALDALVVKMDGDAKSYLGVIVLLNLVLSVTGLTEDDAAQKSVTAFVRGRWDDMQSKF
jgi:hypothetical protein